MDPEMILALGILLLLLLLSAFFSSAETALTTANKLRIRALTEQEAPDLRAFIFLDITDDPEKMLNTILIGNNIVNLTAPVIATSVAYRIGGYLVGIFTGILTLLIILFGEITPKTIATIHAEKMALFYARPIALLMKLMTPVIFVINKLSLGILILFRIDPNHRNTTLTEKEIRTMVDVGHEDGVIESNEREMICNVFDLGNARAKDIMVPRVHVTCVDINTTYEELLSIFRTDKYTRFPVYEDSADHIIGTINIKDLLLYEHTDTFHLRDILREAHFTYEFKNTAELLTEMKADSFNIAIVLDEYGDTAGIITLEDILEEIVGEIYDEYDETEEAPIQEIRPREYIAEGSINLADCSEHIGVSLESDEYDSLGGFIIEQLDRLPATGDTIVTENGTRLVVERLDKNRVEQVHIYLPQESSEPSSP